MYCRQDIMVTEHSRKSVARTENKYANVMKREVRKKRLTVCDKTRGELYKLSMDQFKYHKREITQIDTTFKWTGNVRKDVMEWYAGCSLHPRVVIIYETIEGTYFQKGKLTQYYDNVIDYASEHKNQNKRGDHAYLRSVCDSMVNNNCDVYLAQRAQKTDRFKVRRVDSMYERNGEWSINCSQHIEDAPDADEDDRVKHSRKEHTGKYKRGVAFMVGLSEDEVDFNLMLGKGGQPFLSYQIWY